MPVLVLRGVVIYANFSVSLSKKFKICIGPGIGKDANNSAIAKSVLLYVMAPAEDV